MVYEVGLFIAGVIEEIHRPVVGCVKDAGFEDAGTIRKQANLIESLAKFYELTMN